jgi:hypothetical protein
MAFKNKKKLRKEIIEDFLLFTTFFFGLTLNY